MSNYKNLTHINIQTNCNLSFSLLTIKELVDYSISNGIGSLALCESNPYEFLGFYYLCKNSGIKPVWGFKKTVNYNNQLLIINFFPRRYSEYRELNKFFCDQDRNGIIDWSSLGKVITKCLLVLEICNYEEIPLINKLKAKILQYSGEENLQNIYFGLNFFPDRIEALLTYDIQMNILPFFSVKSFNWNDYNLLAQLERTNFTSGFSSVSLSSIPYLSRADLSEHFESRLGESSAAFFNNLFVNLEGFLSKISLFIKRSFAAERGESFELLQQHCAEKLNFLVSSQKQPSYSKILEEELTIIRGRGYASYFLELAKIVGIFQENGIEIGPGRGSATSSLVAYLLGLTLIDPVQNQLFFWRFLNEKRVDFPDVDIDVENQETALHLIEKEYGRQAIAKLIVKKRIGWHSAVIASLKLFRVTEEDSAFIEENVVRFLNFQESRTSSLKINYFLEKYHEAFTLARRIYLLYSGVAPHPSGIIISNEKLSEKLPVRDEGEFPLCLYQQKYTEQLGFKKFDFLSLTESLLFIKYIKERNPLRVPTYTKLNMDDERTWKLLKNCLLVGVFQINTKSFGEIINILQPANFTELLLVISLNRPGANFLSRETSQLNSFQQIGRGRRFEAESINEILSLTYGRIIFEEQISQILSYCFAIDFAEAELIRRNLKVIFNDDKDRRKFKLEFISKTTGKLQSFEKDILWEKIVKSVPYLFNKAHATSYTYLTYYTAYLKANFFADSLVYLLQRNTADYKSIILLSGEAVLMDYKLEIPEINTSFWEWRVNDVVEKVLVVGFSQLGRNFHSFFREVIEERSENGLFRDWKDLLTRLPQHFNSLETEDLVRWIELGLFRSLSANQHWIALHLAALKRYARIVISLGISSAEALPFLLLPEESHQEHSLAWENQRQWESLHFYPSYLMRWRKFFPVDSHDTREQLFILKRDYKWSEDSRSEEVEIYAILTNVKRIKDHYLLTLLSFSSSFELFCSSDFYEKNASLLTVHSEAVFTIGNKRGEKKNSLFINSVSVPRN